MSDRILLGRLPDRRAKLVLVSGEYPGLAEGLQRLGLSVLITSTDKRLPAPIQWHPDMQVCAIGNSIIALKDSSLIGTLGSYGISVKETYSVPGPVYPNDAPCNVLAWNNLALGNPKTADKSILHIAKEYSFTWINTKQGYAACATALVDERSAITADNGIADQLESQGITVLRISAGNIRLPGYPYGFIGGCCGKLAPDVMAFTGKLDRHPEGEQIRKFLSVRGVRPVELMDGELLDTGGLISLF